jgi:O-acetyl-ADP-ribose deacetylase (regulator of RNase III)
MRVGDTELVLLKGDITEQVVDVIVNAANSSLLGGGGVDGAIHAAGGPAILEDCKRIRLERGACPTGEAVISTAGDLRAKHVVHTVGPVWSGGGSGEPDLLRSCYERSIVLAAGRGARTIAFPAISTGVYGYPVELAAPIALGVAAEFAHASNAFDEIRFVLFSDADLEVYCAALAAMEEE